MFFFCFFHIPNQVQSSVWAAEKLISLHGAFSSSSAAITSSAHKFCFELQMFRIPSFSKEVWTQSSKMKILWYGWKIQSRTATGWTLQWRDFIHCCFRPFRPQHQNKKKPLKNFLLFCVVWHHRCMQSNYYILQKYLQKYQFLYSWIINWDLIKGITSMSQLYHKSDMPHTDIRAFYTSLYISGMFFLSACFFTGFCCCCFTWPLGRLATSLCNCRAANKKSDMIWKHWMT